MSATLIPSVHHVPPPMRQTPLARPTTSSVTLRSDDHFVDYQPSPFPSQDNVESDTNPVPELISDDVFHLLRENDLISEKGIRDHIIRRSFKSMREEQALKSSEALAKLQAIYPYLQIDTIRKIIYRIGPGAHRKAMI